MENDEKTEISARDALIFARILLGGKDPIRIAQLVGSLSPGALHLGNDLRLVRLGENHPNLAHKADAAKKRCAALLKWVRQTHEPSDSG